MEVRSTLSSLVLSGSLVAAACGGAPAGPPAAAENGGATAPSASVAREGIPPASPPPGAPSDREGAPASVAPATDAAVRDPAPSSVSKSTAEPKRIGARHILIQYMGAERAEASVVRSREQALAVAQAVLKRARAGEDFARLAIEFSDEPGAGPRGGSLGRFGRGQMVPAFDAVAFKLAVGEISAVVETPFGFHVIQRTE